MTTPEQLYTAARETLTLLPRTQALITHTTNQVDESQIKRTKTVHRIPWNNDAATLYFDIHAAVRRHEAALTLLLFGHARYRGGDDQNTLDAVSRLPVLLDRAHTAGHQHHDTVTTATTDLTAWPRQLRALLDEPRDGETPWTKAPGNLVCPHCEQRLHLAPGWRDRPDHADLVCRTPDCADEHGHQPRWAPSAWVGLVQPDPAPAPPGVTLTAYATMHNMRRNTLDVWAHRGLEPVGHDPAGVALYDVNHLDQRRAASTGRCSLQVVHL
ncbi:hypothetical protein CLV28_0698 [Sediminihabitans luteus]|uniref:Uncharacterized protein n=1 Tax=Sediminihabitans luteus TaxID=1138585 RepID=A0A2M9CZZ4_9CELL|nr:hypothetical protein [Sediminihabitans luteus]PJJ77479.1 hypothetical protein CLV28_0698 [Sediminihabitans luteus]GII98375.1 hypothetical protein Slu03_07530 [Sediminihabitans luteus]